MEKSSGARVARSERGQRAPVSQEGCGLPELARRFAQFRAKRRRGTRIPEDLRTAALRALEAGVTQSELQRRCGVSSSMVQAWRAARTPSVADERGARDEVRAFRVVGAEGVDERTPASSPVAPELVLRIGTWSVTIRTTGTEEAGGPTCCR